MSALDDPALELIKRGDLRGAHAALTELAKANPDDREIIARIQDVEALIRKREGRKAPGPAAERKGTSRSWLQTLVLGAAILGAGVLIARRQPAPPAVPVESPPPPVAEAPRPTGEPSSTPHPVAAGAPERAADDRPAPSPPPAAVRPGEAPPAVTAPAPAARATPVSKTARCINNGAPGCQVEVGFDGGRLQLQVDTGADMTMLSVEAAHRAGLRWDSTNPVLTMRGVAGNTSAVLVRASVTVASQKEEDVLVTVAPVKLGRSDGLLGMTFLERFRSSIGGGELRLLPIDAADSPRPGGHGRSWWSMRFRGSQARLERLEPLIGLARDADRQIASEFGVDPGATTNEELVRRYTAFSQSERDELVNFAGRNGVPLEWRR